MERRYYLVNESGKALDAIREWQRLTKEAQEKALKLREELKAINVRSCRDKLIDFEFDVHPGIGWIPAQDREPKFYRPDSRTKIGKALLLKMKEVQIPTSETFADLIGGGHFIVSGNMWGRISFEKIGDKFIISVPIPGQVGNEPMDGEFTPPGCKLLKMSEYYALKEKAAKES